MLDIREILRRVQCGESDRQIAQDLGVDRKTVRGYRRWADESGVLGEGERRPPSEEQLEQLLAARKETEKRSDRHGQVSTVEPYRELVTEWLAAGLSVQVIFQQLQSREYTGSYTSVRRFVNKLREAEPQPAFVRVEVAPGEEAQVDFGSAGKMYDPTQGKVRSAHAFVMTLSHSRHQYVEFVFDQKVPTWLGVHRHGFEFFGGVPKRIVLDNLKAGIVKASLHDPIVQRAYRELAEHYGFLISPCRPRTPRHKGKVERGGVAYVKGNFLPGRSFRNVQDANEQVLAWVMEVAGRREHGTTKQVPLKVFDLVERPALLPLPEQPFLLCCYTQPKLHPDCHVVFDGAYYSAPFRVVGQTLLLKATEHQVELYHEHKLVAVHSRATRRGQRVTLEAHFPPEKAAFLLKTPAWCLRRAREIGPATGELLERLLSSRPLDRRKLCEFERTAQAILRLSDRHGDERLEAACARCLAFDEQSYQAVKRILDKGLDKQLVLPVDAASSLASPTFARSGPELFGAELAEFNAAAASSQRSTLPVDEDLSFVQLGASTEGSEAA